MFPFFPVLYYKGPNYYHASYVVLVNDYEDDSNLLDMQSNYRVADSTNKEMILASVTRPDNLEYSNWKECLTKIQEFKITEIIPKRFMLNQLNTNQTKSWCNPEHLLLLVTVMIIFNKFSMKYNTFSFTILMHSFIGIFGHFSMTLVYL